MNDSKTNFWDACKTFCDVLVLAILMSPIWLPILGVIIVLCVRGK